jgi:hypothetical protein
VSGKTFQTQEREAKENMKRKAKELQQQRREAQKYGKKPSGFGGGGFGASSFRQESSMIDTSSVDTPKPSYTTAPRSVMLNNSESTNTIWVILWVSERDKAYYKQCHAKSVLKGENTESLKGRKYLTLEIDLYQQNSI